MEPREGSLVTIEGLTAASRARARFESLKPVPIAIETGRIYLGGDSPV